MGRTVASKVGAVSAEGGGAAAGSGDSAVAYEPTADFASLGAAGADRGSTLSARAAGGAEEEAVFGDLDAVSSASFDPGPGPRGAHVSPRMTRVRARSETATGQERGWRRSIGFPTRSIRLLGAFVSDGVGPLVCGSAL
jgi:hypothetical protein